MKKLILAFTALLAILSFTSCLIVTDGYSFEINGSLNISYPYVYSEYDITEPVSSLNINWLSGTVCLEYNDNSNIHIYEKTSRSASQAEQLDYYVNNGTLYIYYNSRRKIISSSLNKYLIISIPRNLELGALYCETTSGDILIGNINIQSVGCITTSGSINGSFVGTCTDFSASTTSGSIHIAGDNIQTFKITSTSGSISYASNVISNSGSINTTSGSIVMKIPVNDGFCATISTTSGSFDSDFPLSKRGSLYTYKNQNRHYSIGTTSGSIKLRLLD